MDNVNSYTMQKKVEGETKDISLQTKASSIILSDGTTLDAKIEEFESILTSTLTAVIDDKIKTACDELYEKIMNDIN